MLKIMTITIASIRQPISVNDSDDNNKNQAVSGSDALNKAVGSSGKKIENLLKAKINQKLAKSKGQKARFYHQHRLSYFQSKNGFF